MAPSTIDRLIGFTEELASVFEQCSIPYYAGHPLTSLLLGELSSEDNLVIVATITADQVPELVQSMPDHLYSDLSQISQALSGEGSGFGIVDATQQQMAEVWLSLPDEFSLSKMTRRVQYPGNRHSIWLCSAEDTVLDKLILEQYRDRSGPHWRGLMEVLKKQSSYLDYTYLGEWATRLGLSHILSLALLEAEI